MNRVILTDRDGESDLNRLREREGKMNRVIWTDQERGRERMNR